MATQNTVYNPLEVADFFIGKAANGLDALQIMKLTYIAHGYVLGLFNRPLLEDDVEAWKHGPVVRRIYNRLPGGYQRIRQQFTQEQATFDQETLSVLEGVFAQYGNLAGTYLSSLTHAEGSPWHKTWTMYGKNAVIPQDLIKDHYKQIISNHQAAVAQNKAYSPIAF